jgi:LysM repeat protein
MLWVKFFRIVLPVCCALAVCGCAPTGAGGADEEKEPQFLIGRSRVNAMNFSGAIEAFEDALEMNPRSAAAHFELGWLYAEKEADPAAAIYHYQKYLKFRPTAANAGTIQQHIFRLKQELAKAALPIPPTTEMQRQLEQLLQEKRDLQAEVDRLRQALAQAAITNRTMLPGNAVRSSAPSNAVVRRTELSTSSQTPQTTSVPRVRTYRVQAGDTPAAIARRHNVSLENLLAANPALNPRRMQIGQSIRIPSP